MNPRKINFGNDSRAKLLFGVNLIANAVRVTMGPMGRNVIIQKKGDPHITKDGVSVAREVSHPDNYVDMAIKLVRQVASRANDVAGDGTTTATVLAQAITVEGMSLVANGFSPTELRNGMEEAKVDIVDKLKELSISCDSKQKVYDVAYVSSNGDERTAEVVAKAYGEVGSDGIIMVEDGVEDDTIVVTKEGMSFERGFMSPYFVNNPTRNEVNLDNPMILLVDFDVEKIEDILLAIRYANGDNRSLLIVANAVSNEVIGELVHLNSRMSSGVGRIVAVRSPEFGQTRSLMLGDMATALGIRVVSEIYNNVPTEEDIHEYIGEAESVVVYKNETIIQTIGTLPDGTVAQANRVRDQLTDLKLSHYDRDRLEKRLAILSGKVSTIFVGGRTEAEMYERRDRTRDAVSAVKSALKEGILAGGGAALLAVYHTLIPRELKVSNGESDSKTKYLNSRSVGYNALLECIRAPFKQIRDNGDLEVTYDNPIVEHDGNVRLHGINLRTMEEGDLIDLGVIDPTRVVRSSLEAAVSIASLIITTEALVVDDETVEPPPRRIGHWDM